MSTSIAARIAYSYGYDAKDPGEQIFIQRLVRLALHGPGGQSQADP